ncbi:hypothetical protein E2C01_018701 [Portunus trituberculatus]|uniref:Uncharacterized protein n=1 Tax=Portunus trituberculatus TaxID=210409 RepID=A0A5B7DX97_PORTR|nr:hypothetical protein [Portunus trituberculatus]
MKVVEIEEEGKSKVVDDTTEPHHKPEEMSKLEDINKINELSRKWKLEFNAKKCHIRELGKRKRRLAWN